MRDIYDPHPEIFTRKELVTCVLALINSRMTASDTGPFCSVHGPEIQKLEDKLCGIVRVMDEDDVVKSEIFPF